MNKCAIVYRMSLVNIVVIIIASNTSINLCGRQLLTPFLSYKQLIHNNGKPIYILRC